MNIKTIREYPATIAVANSNEIVIIDGQSALDSIVLLEGEEEEAVNRFAGR